MGISHTTEMLRSVLRLTVLIEIGVGKSLSVCFELGLG
jgi:hypothetical protein